MTTPTKPRTGQLFYHFENRFRSFPEPPGPVMPLSDVFRHSRRPARNE